LLSATDSTNLRIFFINTFSQRQKYLPLELQENFANLICYRLYDIKDLHVLELTVKYNHICL